MNTIGNLLWIILGGFIIFIFYLIGSIILMITIIGIPFGIQTLKMANLAFSLLEGKQYKPNAQVVVYRLL